MALPLVAEDRGELACGRCDAATEGVVGIDVVVAVVVAAGTACDGLRGVLLGAIVCMYYMRGVVVVSSSERGSVVELGLT